MISNWSPMTYHHFAIHDINIISFHHTKGRVVHRKMLLRLNSKYSFNLPLNNSEIWSEYQLTQGTIMHSPFFQRESFSSLYICHQLYHSLLFLLLMYCYVKTFKPSLEAQLTTSPKLICCCNSLLNMSFCAHEQYLEYSKRRSLYPNINQKDYISFSSDPYLQANLLTILQNGQQRKQMYLLLLNFVQCRQYKKIIYQKTR